MDYEPEVFEHDISDDIIAYDSREEPILVIHADPYLDAVDLGVRHTLASMASTDIPFGMFVDPDVILIFRADRPVPGSPALELKTSEILPAYHPAFGQKRASRILLETLIESWLRDVAFRWNSDHPPALEQLEAIGLAARLAGGMTRNGYERAHPVHRD